MFQTIILTLLLFTSDIAIAADSEPVMATQLTGGDELHKVDVIQDGQGVKRIATDASIDVTVEEILGKDNLADTWFEITACANTSTLRVQIAASTWGDPAVDVTTTFTTNDLEDCADEVIADLNADGNFSPYLKATRVTDNPVVHISSRFVDGRGERLASNDFQLTAGGATTYILETGNDVIKTRQKVNSLARDPADPRIGTFGISGTIFIVPAGVGDRFLVNALDGSSPDLRVDGSSTPVDFTIDADADQDTFVSELRFFGGCNGIKFNQFFCKNQELTNGLEVTLRSDGAEYTFPDLKKTEDFKNKFSIGSAANFRLDIQSGGDQFLAVLSFETPFPIRKAGTVAGGDDFIRIRVQDDLTGSQGGNLTEFEFLVAGFRRDV